MEMINGNFISNRVGNRGVAYTSLGLFTMVESKFSHNSADK